MDNDKTNPGMAAPARRYITSHEVQQDFLPEGSIFEYDGHLYLVEKRSITIALEAQMIEPRLRDLERRSEDGERVAVHPCFAHFEAGLDNELWDEITPLSPETR